MKESDINAGYMNHILMMVTPQIRPSSNIDDHDIYVILVAFKTLNYFNFNYKQQFPRKKIRSTKNHL